MKKVSIIIPVYNVEKYIGRAIVSLLSQTYSNIEIILVDDGSQDGSGVICDTFASQYENIKVIHQKNAGVSHARNRGIEESTGEYVGFLDADDIAVPSMYKSLVDALEKDAAHIASCNSVLVFEDDIPHRNTIPINKVANSNIYNKEQALLLFLKDGIGEGVWNKLFKKSTVDGLKFDENLKHNEDKLFLFYALLKSDKHVHINRGLHLYYQRQGSATKSKFSPNLFDVEFVTEQIERLITEKYESLTQESKYASLLALLRLYRTLLLMETKNAVYETGCERIRQKILDYGLRNNFFLELFIIKYSPWLFKRMLTIYVQTKERIR